MVTGRHLARALGKFPIPGCEQTARCDPLQSLRKPLQSPFVLWGRSMRTGAILLFVLATTGCARSRVHDLPDDAAILQSDKTAALLDQCSRDTPPKGGATWRPAADDVIGLERALHAALSTRSWAAPSDWTKAPDGWRRQYVGTSRDGRRIIYGNFFPRKAGDDHQWRNEPLIYCDGGPGFFGVEYDVEAHRITHLDFNGEG